MKKLLITLLLIVVSGCASISNEGKVDFRRTDLSSSFKKSDEKNDTKNKHKENITTNNFNQMQEFKAKNFSLGDQSSFEKGDSLSLHLRSAFISNFSENILTPYITKAFTRQWGETVGEVAIVANAFEEKNGKELDFGNMKEGRVVFYSDDVHKGQFLNFDNMPIYGPLKYDGAPFAFRIAIFELDVISEQAKAMLNTVALAGSTAYPPASPVLEILNGIGSTFYDGDQTDIEFRYTMVLDHKGGSKTVNHLKLEVGNYVLIRVEDRNTYVPWDKLVLNENESMLYRKDKDGKPAPYTENTYLVVEINKNVSGTSVELAENNFSNLIAVLQERDKAKAESWKYTNDAIMKVAIQRSQIKNFDRAKEILDDLDKSDQEISKLEKRTEAEELFKMIAKSINADGDFLTIDPKKQTLSYNLSASQIKYILKKLRKLIALKVNNNNWQILAPKNIALAFGANQAQVKQIEILNIVAPL